MNPAALTCQALLNCLIREVSMPEQQAWEDDGHLVIRLARSGATCAGSRSAGRTWPG